MTLRLDSGPVSGNFATGCYYRGRQVELVGIAGAGQDDFHVGPADVVGGAAANSFARAVVEPSPCRRPTRFRPCLQRCWIARSRASLPMAAIKNATAVQVSRRAVIENDVVGPTY